MVIIGEAAPGKDTDPFGTTYVDFYASMLKVPFLGSYFNTIMPLFILVFGMLFAIMSVFKLKSQALSALKRVQKFKDEVTDKIPGNDKEDPLIKKKASDNQPSAAINTAQLSIVENILKGEKSILAEFELDKKREERNKLTRFNDPTYQAKQEAVMIEMATKKPAEDLEKGVKTNGKLDKSNTDNKHTLKKQATIKSGKDTVQKSSKDDKKKPLLSDSSDSSSEHSIQQ